VGVTDTVFLERMQFYGYHGHNPEERALGQRFEVDVSLETSTRAAGMSDELADTVNYSAVFKTCRQIVEGEPKKLIESVAESIARQLLASEPRVSAVQVTIRKPQAPLKGGIFGAAGVTIQREQESDRS